MEVFGGRRLVSRVVDVYVEGKGLMHMVIVVDNHNEGHHIH